MEKVYLYAISFFHSTGNGCVQIMRTKKINSLEEYNSVRQFIEKDNNLKNVAIINYQLICKCERTEIETKGANNELD